MNKITNYIKDFFFDIYYLGAKAPRVAVVYALLGFVLGWLVF